MDSKNLDMALADGSGIVVGKSDLGRLLARAGYGAGRGDDGWRETIVIADRSRPDTPGGLRRMEDEGLDALLDGDGWRAFRSRIVLANRLSPVIREIASLDTEASNLAARAWVWSFLANAEGRIPAKDVDAIVPELAGFDFGGAATFADEFQSIPAEGIGRRIDALLRLPGSHQVVKDMRGDWRPILHGVSVFPEGDGFRLSESVDFDGGFSDDHVAVLSEITPEAVSVAFHAKDGDRPTM